MLGGIEDIQHGLLVVREVGQRYRLRGVRLTKCLAKRQMLKLGENVLGVFAKRGSVADQVVAAPALRRVDPTRHGEHLPVIVGGHVGGDERAAFQVGLHHHGAKRHSGNDAVADREALLVALPIERKLGDHRAVFDDVLVQFCVLRRVNDVDPGAEHGDRSALRREGALVRGGIDAPRAAADHRDTVAGELVGQFAGGVLPVMRRAPRTDHRDAVFVLRQQAAL